MNYPNASASPPPPPPPLPPLPPLPQPPVPAAAVRQRDGPVPEAKQLLAEYRTRKAQVGQPRQVSRSWAETLAPRTVTNPHPHPHPHHHPHPHPHPHPDQVIGYGLPATTGLRLRRRCAAPRRPLRRRPHPLPSRRASAAAPPPPPRRPRLLRLSPRAGVRCLTPGPRRPPGRPRRRPVPSAHHRHPPARQLRPAASWPARSTA